MIASCEKSLADLRLDYLDLYLVHWPFPNHHPPGCDVSARNPHAMPYIHENYMRTWRKMEELVDRGLVRHIGTSNMTIPKMELLLRDCAHQAGGQRDGTASAFSAAGVLPLSDRARDSAHRLLAASVRRRGRSATARRTTPRPTEDPVIRAIAERHRRASGGGVHQVGGAARADADSVLDQSAQHLWPTCAAW